ncbi:MAG: hypothetical protein ABIG65_01020 [Patescibacteria group bacterium]
MHRSLKIHRKEEIMKKMQNGKLRIIARHTNLKATMNNDNA